MRDRARKRADILLHSRRRASTLSTPDPQHCPAGLLAATNQPGVRGPADLLFALHAQPTRGAQNLGHPAEERTFLRSHHTNRRGATSKCPAAKAGLRRRRHLRQVCEKGHRRGVDLQVQGLPRVFRQVQGHLRRGCVHVRGLGLHRVPRVPVSIFASAFCAPRAPVPGKAHLPLGLRLGQLAILPAPLQGPTALQ